jgi:acetyl-CoA carboxylase biotin carboxyl carrier protein
MIDFDFISRLIRAFDDSGVDSLELERGGTRVKLAKTPPTAAVSLPAAAHAPAAPSAPPLQPTPQADSAPSSGSPTTPAAADDLVEIPSPMVGTFYRAPAPDAPAYVEVGDRVAPGDTLCIIEAMKLMNELECEVSGTIREVCAENAQPVEFGQVLFRVEPA